MRNERGFTLPELLIAIVIIGVGLVGLAVVMPLAGYALQQGNQLTTATFLGELRLEQVRGLTWSAAAAVDCLGKSAASTAPSTTTATCTVGPCAGLSNCVTLPDEASGAIAGFPGYRRTVRIVDCGVAPGCGTVPFVVQDASARLVTVAVTFNPMTGVGAASATRTFTTSVDLIIAER
jgi:prepilin-type N-terminal cleavage/methylation domain-containing protein